MMKVMKVYDLGAEINAIVLMTPCKYSIRQAITAAQVRAGYCSE